MIRRRGELIDVANTKLHFAKEMLQLIYLIDNELKALCYACLAYAATNNDDTGHENIYFTKLLESYAGTRIFKDHLRECNN